MLTSFLSKRKGITILPQPKGKIKVKKRSPKLLLAIAAELLAMVRNDSKLLKRLVTSDEELTDVINHINELWKTAEDK